MTQFRLILHLLLLLSCLSHLRAGELAAPEPGLKQAKILIATDLWAGFTEPDGRGAYQHLLALIFPHHTDLTFHYTSYSRAVAMVEQQQADMVIGIGRNDSRQVLLSDWPFDVDQIAVLYLAGQLQLDESSQLSQLQLATQRGYNYNLVLNIDTVSYQVNSIQTGVSMVKNRRVDAFLVEKTELKNKLSAEDLAGLELRFLKGEPIFMGFADNTRGLELKRWWDQQYQQLYLSGQLELLYLQYPDFILPELALRPARTNEP